MHRLLLLAGSVAGLRVKDKVCAYDRVDVEWSQEGRVALMDTGRIVAFVPESTPRLVEIRWEPPWIDVKLESATQETELVPNLGPSSWISSDHIRIFPTDAASTDAAVRDGSLTLDVLRQSHFRVSSPGLYSVALLHNDDDDDDIIAEAPLLVESCDLLVIDNAEEEERDTTPWFEMDGTFALTGLQALQVPDAELPGGLYPSKGGALSMWFYLAEGPTGAHRGLFFKGDPNKHGGQRTPSAWLLPDSNRLALRVSSDDGNMDLGADSKTNLPLHRWTHLAFVFDFHGNTTSNYLLYVDGKLDSNLTLGDIAYQTGPLFIGKDPERNGPRGLLSELKVWASPLDSRAIKAEARRRDLPTPPEFVHSTTGKETDVVISTKQLQERAVNATQRCADINERLALYEAAALAGDVVSARRAAELYVYGAERLSTGAQRCRKSHQLFDLEKAVMHWKFAAERQDPASARELALLGLAGVLPQENALGLLYWSASLNDARAALALAARYELGWDTSIEAAAWHARIAADVANKEYHTPGEQTHVEMDRLTEKTLASREDETAQRGDDDAMLRAQMDRAEQGDPTAMMATGDLLYWGARGFDRDHVRARRYFGQAAELPHFDGRVIAMCRYASMLLRGEGGATDHALAVKYYERAASLGSAVALNGLGYEYFFGHTVPQNKTRAFGYFSEAALLDADGDSNFNAALMLHEGLGTEQDVHRAAALYEHAATRHGHFDSALKVAVLRHDGDATFRRDPHSAYKYFLACARAGWLARDVRAGFDTYLDRRTANALSFYAQAAYLGFGVAAMNAAWLIDHQNILGSFSVASSLPFHRLQLDLAFDADAANAVALDALQHGDCRTAVSWYSRAAVTSPAAVLATATLHARGLCLPRSAAVADDLFRSALTLDDSPALKTTVFLHRLSLAFDDRIALPLLGRPIFFPPPSSSRQIQLSSAESSPQNNSSVFSSSSDVVPLLQPSLLPPPVSFDVLVTTLLATACAILLWKRHRLAATTSTIRVVA